jgi:hypothetical protein
VLRDNLGERRATIWMRIRCRGDVDIRVVDCRAQGLFDVDCRGASISEIGLGEIGWRRLGWRTSWPTFSLDGLAATIAFDIQLEDRGVMDEAIDGGERHGGILD